MLRGKERRALTSMTGFGHSEFRDAKCIITVELRSYNNRYLDLFINLPPGLKIFEPDIREYLSARVRRGKVEMYLGLTETEETARVSVDETRVREYLAALQDLKRIAGIRSRITLSHLTGLEGVLKMEASRNPEELWQKVLPVIEAAFSQFQLSRQTEGQKTQQDIRRLALEVRGRVESIEALVPKIEEKIVSGLRERFRQVLADAVEESRILAETAVLLMRFDINEEMQRMKAHLDSLLDSLAQEGEQGKRLEFICQELGREVNTIGSKSMMLDVDQNVIASKDLLEKIREQIRNVE